MTEDQMKHIASGIRLLLTDVDGVLTDNGVYYTDQGEQMKRYSIRDGMGVQRLRVIAGIETGIVTGETSGSVSKRAEKLLITEIHLGVKDKLKKLEEILERKKLHPSEVAFIGDDVNDLEIMQKVGISACPSDGMDMIKGVAHFTCEKKGGHGAFREFAEWLISAKHK